MSVTAPVDSGVRASIGAWLVRHGERIAVLAFMVAYTAVYWLDRQTPGNGRYGNWWRWHDQKMFRAAAEALGHLHYGPEAHYYPIGYPLLGAPFAALWPEHLFFVPNLLLVTGIAVLLYRFARSWFSKVESGAIVVVAALAARQAMMAALMPPWSTIPTHFLGYLMFWLLLTWKPGLRLVWTLVLLDGLAYLCRPGDAAFLSPVLVAAVLQLPDWGSRVRGALSGMALLSLFPLSGVLLNESVSGAPISAYEARHVATFAFNRFWYTVYATHLDGMPIYRFSPPVILERMPWLVLGLPGLIYAVRSRGWRWAVVGGTLALSWAFYMVYWNMSPVGLYRYVLIHYIAWIFPMAALFTWLTFRRALAGLPWAVALPALLVPALLVWTVRLDETDPVHAHVGPEGEIVLDGPSQDARFDLLAVYGHPADWAAAITRDGVREHRGAGIHYRRDVDEQSAQEGFEILVPRPFQPSEIRFTDPRMVGAELELRRLKWGLGPYPVGLAQRIHGEGWGYDPLARTRTVPASALRTAVGQPGPDGIASTGTAGDLVQGPVLDAPRGAWIATWYGTVRTPTPVRAQVWRTEGGITKLHATRTVLLRPTPGGTGPLASLSFRIGRRNTTVTGTAELRLDVPAQADLTVTRVELRPPVPEGSP